MPLVGRGMLITSMDVDPADEQDFNLWYDREHLAERVGIDGFLEARRWIVERAPTKYFCTYSTDHFEALSSPHTRRCWQIRPTGPRNTSHAFRISAGSSVASQRAEAKVVAHRSGLSAF